MVMGADLYVKSNYEKLNAKYRQAFERAVARRDRAKTAKEQEAAQQHVSRVWDLMNGDPRAYYRDSYNRWTLLAQLGLSWWRDVAPLLTEDDHLPLDGVSWLLEEIRNRRLQCQTSPTYEQEVAAEVVSKVGGKSGPSPKAELCESYTADDVEWFVARKRALITFLETCLELAEEPVCSL